MLTVPTDPAGSSKFIYYQALVPGSHHVSGCEALRTAFWACDLLLTCEWCAALQGVWLCEHRDHASGRRLTVTMQGE